VRIRLGAVLGLLAMFAAATLISPASAHPDPVPPADTGTAKSEIAFEPDLIPLPDGSVTSAGPDALTASAATPGTRFAGFNGLPAPERMLDTRTGNGVAGAGLIGPGQSFSVQFAGRGSVPADATAVVMNVTADAPSDGGFITVYPAGEAVPNTSNINIVPGKTVPNLVVMRLNGGAASFYNAFGTTHLIADVLAYSRDDGHFVGFSPVRFLDTRTGVGAPAAKVGPGGRIDVNVLGFGSVPTDASRVGAVIINVTADQPTAPSFVTAWPSGVAMPNASSLNFTTNQTVANLVFAPVGADGRVSFFNESGDVHLIGDIVGYVPSGAAYMPVTPTRVVDTRTGLGTDSTSPLGPGQSILVSPYSSIVAGTLSSDQDIAAYVLNVTAAGPTAKSFLTMYPFGQPLPDASNLNTVAGENVPNAVVVSPGVAGLDVIRNDQGFTHVIVDIVGIIPKQNAVDTPDDAGGSRFHVVYLLGSDSSEDTQMPTKIRQELEGVNSWMASETGGAGLDFARTNGQIDVLTWRLPNWTENELVHWEQYIVNNSYYELPYQLLQDGFGFPGNHKALVYINGNRDDGLCGATYGQYATLFTSQMGGCNIIVDGTTADIGGTANTELVALHEAFHALRAVPSCGSHWIHTSAHSDLPSDLMYPGLNPVGKHIDVARDTYFGHSISGCVDLQDSPFMTTVGG
jgi:hypothetical protein